MRGHSIKFLGLGDTDHSAARISELNLNFDKHGGKISEPTTFESDVFIPLKPFLNNEATSKKYVDDEIAKLKNQDQGVDTSNLVQKSGNTMAGDLILQSQPYPIQGNTNKALSYRAARDIFLSRKESFQMDTSVDMNNKTSHEAVTKKSTRWRTCYRQYIFR